MSRARACALSARPSLASTAGAPPALACCVAMASSAASSSGTSPGQIAATWESKSADAALQLCDRRFMYSARSSCDRSLYLEPCSENQAFSFCLLGMTTSSCGPAAARASGRARQTAARVVQVPCARFARPERAAAASRAGPALRVAPRRGGARRAPAEAPRSVAPVPQCPKGLDNCRRRCAPVVRNTSLPARLGPARPESARASAGSRRRRVAVAPEAPETESPSADSVPRAAERPAAPRAARAGAHTPRPASPRWLAKAGRRGWLPTRAVASREGWPPAAAAAPPRGAADPQLGRASSRAARHMPRPQRAGRAPQNCSADVAASLPPPLPRNAASGAARGSRGRSGAC